MTTPPLSSIVSDEMIHTLEAATEKLLHCVGQLSDEQLWWRPADDQNSVGNLMLHLAGNLRQWVIVGLTGAEDHRDRQAEFDMAGGIDRGTLSERLTETVREANGVLRSLGSEEWSGSREVQGFDVTGVGAAFHSVAHFVGHTHQIVLLTRMQLGDAYRYHWTPATDRKGGVPV